MGNSARRRTVERSRHRSENNIKTHLNPLNAELNPICHLLALLGGAIIVVVSRLRVKAREWMCGRHSCDSRLNQFTDFARVLKGKEFRE